MSNNKSNQLPIPPTAEACGSPRNESMNENLKNQSEVKTIPEAHITQKMRESIDVLFQAVEMGRKAGIYSFKDATLIGNAIELLGPYITSDQFIAN